MPLVMDGQLPKSIIGLVSYMSEDTATTITAVAYSNLGECWYDFGEWFKRFADVEVRLVVVAHAPGAGNSIHFRLYNNTDGVAIAGSVIDQANARYDRLVSAPFTGLVTGTKEYQPQGYVDGGTGYVKGIWLEIKAFKG